MESKANYSSLMVRKETKKEIIALRTGMSPNTSIHGFVQEMVDYYRDRHCPQCGNNVAGGNRKCNCWETERQ